MEIIIALTQPYNREDYYSRDVYSDWIYMDSKLLALTGVITFKQSNVGMFIQNNLHLHICPLPAVACEAWLGRGNHFYFKSDVRIIWRNILSSQALIIIALFRRISYYQFSEIGSEFCYPKKKLIDSEYHTQWIFFLSNSQTYLIEPSILLIFSNPESPR